MLRTSARNLMKIVALCMVLALAQVSLALINPNFTPVHLEHNSKWVLAVRVHPLTEGSTQTALDVLESIKGKDAPAKLSLDFAEARKGKDGENTFAYAKELFEQNGDQPAFLSISESNGKVTGLLHVSGIWARINAGADASAWTFERFDEGMLPTFRGATDMLLESMRFMQRFSKSPIMGTSAGVQWDSHEKIGQVESGAQIVIPVDANGDGRLDLFASGPQGSVLWMNKGERFEESRFKSSFMAAVWVDLNADGRPDCAGINRQGSLEVLQQDASGKYVSRESTLPGKLNASPALHAFQVAGQAKPELLITGGDGVWQGKPKDDGTWDIQTLTVWPKDAGQAGPSVSADFDGDGNLDILWFGEKSGLFLKSNAEGAFAAKNVAVGIGGPKARRLIASDLNGDGRAEVIAAGGGVMPAVLRFEKDAFQDVSRFMGEPSYIMQGGAEFLTAGDFNNDGWVDFFVGYGKEDGQFFFNRGFRTFAISEPLKFKTEDLPGVDGGQASGAWADFDGDGALDFVCALSNGDVYLSKSSVGALTAPVCIQVVVDKKCAMEAPVEVTLERDGHILASRTTQKFGPAAIFGMTEGAEYGVHWKLPGKPDVVKKVKVAQEAVTVPISD